MSGKTEPPGPENVAMGIHGRKTKPQGFPWGFDGGAGRDRTDDLNTASVALSQLSYGPF